MTNTQFTKGMTPWNKGLKGCYTLSEETKRKISESLKGRIPWLKGKHHSEETRAKISSSNMGRPGLPRDGKNNAMWGRHHSEETKRKMSAAMRKCWIERKGGNTNYRKRNDPEYQKEYRLTHKEKIEGYRLKQKIFLTL